MRSDALAETTLVSSANGLWTDDFVQPSDD